MFKGQGKRPHVGERYIFERHFKQVQNCKMFVEMKLLEAKIVQNYIICQNSTGFCK